MPNQQLPPDAQSTKQIGKGMFVIAWLLFLALLTFGFNHFEAGRRDPNAKLRSRVLPGGAKQIILQGDRQHHYRVSGKINGQPVRFLLDTGASDVSIPGAVAERLRLERGIPLTANTAAGPVTVYGTRLERLAIGPIVLTNVRASINPHDPSTFILLGMSALSQLNWRQESGRLIVTQPSTDSTE